MPANASGKAARAKPGRSPLARQRERWGLLFILPQLFSLLMLGIIPIFIAFVLGFFDWNGLTPPVFVGLKNFATVFRDSSTFRAIGNTFLFALGYAPLLIVISLLISLLLNKAWGKMFYRAAMFMPQIVNSVAIAVVWSWIYQPQIGILNVILRFLGFEGQSWLQDPRFAMGSVIAMSIWWGAGYNIVLFLAGLQNVPRTLVEAAQIDGAKPWHVFWRITLPMISPTTLFVVINTTINAFQAYDQLQLLTAGGPAQRTYTLTLHIYQTAFRQFRMGEASAIALVLFVIVVAASILQFAISDKHVYYGE